MLAVRDGHARLEEVRVRGRNPEWAAVEGLAPGTLVVSRASEVSPGQGIRPRRRGPS